MVFSAMLEEGQAAPDFELTSDSGAQVKLSDFRGQPVVLYFYPKSDTPGCTTQAHGIRDAYAEFERAGAVVLGVSSDKQAAQAKFKAKHDLPFTILADPDHVAGKAYGVEKPDSPYFERSTFVIDADGKIAKIMRRVDSKQHAERVLEALAA
jgi:peroxiredoxin Q/BCP